MTPQVSDAILRAISYIEEHLTSKVSVQDMAGAAGYSVFHFSRIFNKVTGHSPYDYLMRRKLSEAAFDVLEDVLTLTDIAFKYAFVNYETFSRAFQKFFGSSPSDFREAGRVHALQWKRRLSVDYLNHLNAHAYQRPVRMILEEDLIGGHIIADRHFFDDFGKNLTDKMTSLSYVHFHKEHKHLHECAFMKGSGLLGERLSGTNQVRPDWICKPIEKGNYLRFDYTGSYFQIQNVYTYIFETWMPQAGMDVNVPFVMERIINEENRVEIYIPA